MSETMTKCCAEWAEYTGSVKSIGPAALAYGGAARMDAQIEQAADGSWNINGCCGGQCYVVTDINFCPFCGANLSRAAPTGHG